MFSPGNITEKLRVASLPCAGEVLVDLYAGTSPWGQQGGLARQACRGEQAESGDAGIDSIQMEVNHHEFWIEKCPGLEKYSGIWLRAPAPSGSPWVTWHCGLSSVPVAFVHSS